MQIRIIFLNNFVIYLLSNIFYTECDLDAREKFGRAALFLAAQQGHKDIVDILVNNGAKVNLIDNKGNSPLMGKITNTYFGS